MELRNNLLNTFKTYADNTAISENISSLYPPHQCAQLLSFSRYDFTK